MSPDRKAEILEQFFSLRPPDEGRQLEEGEPSPVRTPSKLEGMTVSEFAQASIVSQAFAEELAVALLATLSPSQAHFLMEEVVNRVKARMEPLDRPEVMALVDEKAREAMSKPAPW
jgi:hypothetical protein